MKVRAIISACSLVLLAGCAQTLPLSSYEQALGHQNQRSPFAAYAPGRQVFVDPGATCSARLSTNEPTSTAASADGGVETQSRGVTLWTVGEARVHGDAGFLALRLESKERGVRWIALKGGEPPTCLHPATPEIVAAFADEGKTFAFTPWKLTCDEIEATGEGVDALFVQSQGGIALVHEGLVLGPPNAVGKSKKGEPQTTPWITAFKGAVKLRADVLRECFTEQAQGSIEPPPDPERFLHVDPSRCQRSHEGGQSHVACTTTVGVWSGVANANAVSLQLVRRTLGRVDFLGRKLVAGSRWANTVVSVSTRRGSEAAYGQLYDVVDREASNALQAEDDVRVASAGDPDVTHTVTIEPQDIVVGPVVTRDEEATSQYKIGERPVPNPAKRRAQDAIVAAEHAVQAAERAVETAKEDVRRAERAVIDAKAEIPKAEQEYRDQQRQKREAIALADQAKKACLSGCNGFSGAKERSNCKMACEIGGTGGNIALSLGMEPSRDGIEQAKEGVRRAEQKVEAARDGVERAIHNVAKAKQQVEEARRHEREVPPTIQEDVMAPWKYVKKIHTRTLSASVAFTVRHPDGREEKKSLPVRSDWTDFDVEPDPKHNVQPHAADRGKLERSDALVPMLATLIGRRVGDQMRLILSAAEREQMRRSLAAAQVASEPEFELVDATAYATVGTRIARVARRGTVQLGQSVLRLPIVGIPVGQGECVLAVASADPHGASEGKLEMLAIGGRFADVRRGPRPAVEICTNELPPGAAVDSILVKSARPEKVHWTLFITHAEAPARARAESTAAKDEGAK